MQTKIFLCLMALLAMIGTQTSTSQAASFTPLADFPFAAPGVVFDSVRAKLYLSQTEAKRVWIVNPATGALEGSFSFDFSPELIALSPDGGTLIVHFPSQFNGSQAYVQTLNLDSGKTTEFFPVSSGSISDMLAIEGDMVVFASNTGGVQSCRIGSGESLGFWGFGENGHLAKGPSPTDFYGVGYYVVRHFSVNPASGQITSPTTRDFYAGYKLFFHPSGTNLITQSGAIFSVSSDPSKDLLYSGGLPFPVEAAAFDTNENAFFAATRTNVLYCDTTTFKVIRAFAVTNLPSQLVLSGNQLICVSVQDGATHLLSMPNPAAGSTTNTPPEPAFSWNPASPDTLSAVNFDASVSADAQDGLQELLFRWDWECDGQFDTDWESSPTNSHLFSLAGESRVTLEIQDSRGMTARVTNLVQITLGSDAGIRGRTNAPFNLPFAASDAVLGPGGTNAFLNDPVGMRVVELDLLTGRIAREFPCSMAPVSLSLTPDARFLYAGLTPGWPRVYQRPYDYGLVHEFNLETGVRTRALVIGADPFDMLATTDTLIVSPASNVQRPSAYWLGNGEARTNFYVGSKKRLASHPSGTAFYGAGTDSVPYDIYRVNFGPSGVISSYDSRYHGDHPVEAGVWVDPQGNLALTRGGGIYTSSAVREDDMIYLQTLEGGLAEDMFFDNLRSALFTIAGTKLCYYNSGNFALARQYPNNPGGRFVLANTNSLFAFSVSSNATTIQVFANPAAGSESNQPPQVNFSWETGSEVPVLVRFDGSSTSDDMDPPTGLLYRWDLDDDGVFDTSFTNSPLAAFRYALPGSKLVTLQVRDRYGALNSKRQAVPIQVVATEPTPGVLQAIFEVPIAASAAVFDPVRPYLYALKDSTRRLLKINLLTGLVEGDLSFEDKPTALTINPGGTQLYVALQQKDWSAEVPSSLIAEFDLSTEFVYRTFPVFMDVYKIAATDRRIVIVTGYSKSMAALASFDSATGSLLGQGGVYQYSDLALHPAQNKVFISERYLSPSSIYQVVFNPQTGQFGDGTAIGSAGGPMFPDRRGEWVLNAYGNVYATNGVLLRRLENGAATDAWFDRSRPALFTAATGNVSFYNPSTLELAQIYPALPGTSFIGGWDRCVYAASAETNRLIIQRLLSPALGAETNAPPQPAFVASETPFPTFQTITFDARTTGDDSTSSDRLLYRWDWDSDGVFDTAFSHEPTAYHRYNLAGEARVTLQVNDEFGAVASLLKVTPVVPAPDFGTATTNLLANTPGLVIVDSVFDPVRPFLYLTDSASNRVFRVDIQTGQMDRAFVLDHAPESIAITPSGSRMYVAELIRPHDISNFGPSRALIDVFDLQTCARVSQFEIQQDPYDLIATEGLLIVSSGSASGGFRTYRPADGKELSHMPSFTSRNIRMALHPSQRFFYGVSAWVTSGDVHRYDLDSTTSSIVETATRSGLDFYLSPLIAVNPCGTNLVTGRGYVCTVTENPATDLAVQTQLNQAYFRSAVFVPERQALFAAQGSSLNFYDARSFELKHSFDLGYSCRQLSVYGDRLYSLCETGTNSLLVSRLLPSASPDANLPPSFVRISNLTNGTVIPLPSVLQLEAAADDPDGWITRVDYYLGLSFLGSSTNTPYRFAWTNPPTGIYPVTAVAHDNWGLTVTSEPIDVAISYRPTVEFTSPALGAVFVDPMALQIGVLASDPDGEVREVQYFLNSTLMGVASAPPFAFVLNYPPIGTNILEALALDNFGTRSIRATNRFIVLPAIPNDLFTGSLPISGSNLTVTASNVRATLEKGEPQHASNIGGHSLWWTWTAPAGGIVTLDTIGSDFDTLLAVYSGNAVTNLGTIAANDDYPGLGALSHLKFSCSAGNVYQIAVDGSRGAAGNVRLKLELIPLPLISTVGNDWFFNRQPVSWISNRISITSSNELATKEVQEPNHAGNSGGKSLWWTWKAPAKGSVTVTTAGSEFDTLVAVYTGVSLFSAASVASNDDDPAGGLTSRTSFNVNAGATYNVAVDGFNGASGKIVLELAFSTNLVDLPFNDQFADRTRLTNASFVQFASSVFASKETLEPSHAGSPGGKSLWWSWTPPVSGPATVSTKGSGFDTLLVVYTGADFAGLKLVAASDDLNTGTTQGEVQFESIAGTEYQIAVDGYNGAGGTAMLSATTDQNQASPINDNFADRSVLGGADIQIESSNVSATREKSEPLIAGREGGKSLWWSWTAPTNGLVIISTRGSDFDTLLGLFRGGSLATLSSIAGNDDLPPETGSRIKTTVAAGTPYQIGVDGYGGACGNVRLDLQFIPAMAPISNDMFANRYVLAGLSNSVVASTVGASRESLEPYHASNSGGHSLWWTWTAPNSGTFTVTTEGSDFDTLLAVYSGAFINSSVVTSNDDAQAGEPTSRATFNAVAGTSYNIAVDGYGGAVGKVRLTLVPSQVNPNKPINDDFMNRTILVGHGVAAQGQNSGATSELGEPSLAGSVANRSVWWTWTAPAFGPVEISTKGSMFDTLLAVYSGDSLTNLTRVAENDDDPLGGVTSRVAFEATVGKTYQIQVDGYRGVSGAIALTLSATSPLTLVSPKLGPEGFAFHVEGPVGNLCVVETSTDLSTWIPISTNRPPFDFVHPGSVSDAARFFRVR